MDVRIMAAMVLATALAMTGCSGTAEGESAKEARPPSSEGAEAASTTPAAAPEPAPVVTRRTERIKKDIPFGSRTRRTADLDRGVRRVAQKGHVGTSVKVVRVTLEDGVEVGRKVVRTFVARKPAPRIVLVGTYVEPRQQPSCDANYSGGCVPIASDVDCGGGSGNGPEYVYGAVEVTGSDVYDLDADGDGWGCD